MHQNRTPSARRVPPRSLYVLAGGFLFAVPETANRSPSSPTGALQANHGLLLHLDGSGNCCRQTGGDANSAGTDGAVVIHRERRSLPPPWSHLQTLQSHDKKRNRASRRGADDHDPIMT